LPAQRFALPALGRAAERRPTGKMLRRRKRLGIAPESPASGARFVSPFFGCQLSSFYQKAIFPKHFNMRDSTFCSKMNFTMQFYG
jgi:hypothetical protein